MNLRCKDKDIALVLYDLPECLGNVGKLVRISGPAEYNRSYRLRCWLIEPLGNETWWVEWGQGDFRFQSVRFSDRVEHPDRWLLPIRDQGVIKKVSRSLETPVLRIHRRTSVKSDPTEKLAGNQHRREESHD